MEEALLQVLWMSLHVPCIQDAHAGTNLASLHADVYHLLQIGTTVGKGEYRVQAAEALVAAVRSSAAASPEVVEMILQARPVLSLQHHVSMLGTLAAHSQCSQESKGLLGTHKTPCF